MDVHNSNNSSFFGCRKDKSSSEIVMNIETSIVKSAATNKGAVAEGGFVKGVVTYMVMDDLEVKPVSTITSITMLNKFNVKDVGVLEE
ncbi:hypothetical protein LWI28_010487 [Acer negundo]|uniref:Uncharacterized protein n=1 Tax=Acer negundo TaxID=4023 RepID=A0AAD5ICA2_ACENE|nr:hypothetical protein LWI28_010487 [Acer negundo]